MLLLVGAICIMMCRRRRHIKAQNEIIMDELRNMTSMRPLYGNNDGLIMYDPN